MTKIEWLELAKTNLLDYSPQNLVAVKCINEVIELEKGDKDNNPNYHASICSSCSPITEKPCHICGVHLTFGKDNSGMVAISKKAITDSLGYPTNRVLTDKELSLINYICENFSQQPPKERKVSLEEIKKVVRQQMDIYNSDYDNKCKQISQAILSLLNATEERKGEE